MNAGLDLEQIRTLVFRLAFEAIVGVGTAALTELVSDQSAEVQAAWRHAIGRMICGDGRADWS